MEENDLTSLFALLLVQCPFVSGTVSCLPKSQFSLLKGRTSPHICLGIRRDPLILGNMNSAPNPRVGINLILINEMETRSVFLPEKRNTLCCSMFLNWNAGHDS